MENISFNASSIPGSNTSSLKYFHFNNAKVNEDFSRKLCTPVMGMEACPRAYVNVCLTVYVCLCRCGCGCLHKRLEGGVRVEMGVKQGDSGQLSKPAGLIILIN